jgi:hypothetical protein
MDLRPYGGDLIAKGESTCVAAESEGDIHPRLNVLGHGFTFAIVA